MAERSEPPSQVGAQQYSLKPSQRDDIHVLSNLCRVPSVGPATDYVLHNWWLPPLKEFQSCCGDKITIYPVKYRKNEVDHWLSKKRQLTGG